MDLKNIGDIILTTTTYIMPKFIIKNRSDTPSPVQDEERDTIMLEVEELPAAAPVIPQPRTNAIPPSFKPHPKHTEFLACEETGKIIWKKENGKIKEKYANSRGYIQLSINGHIAYQKPQEQFIAEIFKPQPPTTVKMESRAEKWVLIINKEYDALKYQGYIPARFIEWEKQDESRRKTAKIQKSRENFGIFSPQERATREILRPANDGGAARRPSASSVSSASSATAETDETDETYDDTLRNEYETLRKDYDSAMRQLERERKQLIDYQIDSLKSQMKRIYSLLSSEEANRIKLELVKEFRPHDAFLG